MSTTSTSSTATIGAIAPSIAPSIAPTGRSNQLLESYGSDSPFFFASPTRTLLASGVDAVIAASGPRLLEQVAAVLAAASRGGHGRPLVVGAVPFDGAARSHLVLPHSAAAAGPLDAAAIAMPTRGGAVARAIHHVPAPEVYARSVERALVRLRAQELGKVVLSRTLEVELERPLDVRALLQRLARQNPSGYTFAVGLPATDVRPPRTLVGASPELLVSRTGRQVVALPLAGSAARSADPEEDRRRANALLTSEKDRHEHEVVADAVVAALRPFCRSLHVPASASLRHTRAMWHLGSRIVGELADPAVSSLHLAAALHPTPAVCGEPVAQARAAIAELEAFDRGFFTGAVGWCDASGDGEWAVTIRCAEVADRAVRLFAGAGVVAASEPDRELAETSAKLGTMLEALGLPSLREVV